MAVHLLGCGKGYVLKHWTPFFRGSCTVLCDAWVVVGTAAPQGCHESRAGTFAFASGARAAGKAARMLAALRNRITGAFLGCLTTGV